MATRKASDYRGYAVECRKLAAMAHSEEQRRLFLDMANTWLQLAEQHGSSPDNVGAQ